MREFFRPWRRKVGCVFLGMACVACSLWVRSAKWEDNLTLRVTAHRVFAIHTYDMGLGLWWLWGTDENATNGYVTPAKWIDWTTNNQPQRFGAVTPLFETLSEQSLFGFSTLRMTDDEDGTVGLRVLIIPYYFPSLGLTLLSALLLLWPHRQPSKESSLPTENGINS